MKRFCLFLTLLSSVCFLPASLFAADYAYTLGGGTNQLQIVISAGGRYMVNRYINGSLSKQFFTTAPLFSIKIGSTVFQADTGFTIEDISSVTNNAVQQQYVTKKFNGTYNSSYAFSVTLTLTYNTTNPEYLIQDAVLDMRNIPAGTPIIFAYGFDARLNLSDRGYAFTLPDAFSLNNYPSLIYKHATKAEVQGLHLVGGRNDTSNGGLIGFFTMGRQFDRAQSSYTAGAYSYGLVNRVAGNGSTSTTGSTTEYQLAFGPYNAEGIDNGVGVGYDNIPPGQETTIRTGLTFTDSLEGELDYTWNGSKNLTATIGANDISLNLAYKSYNTSTISGIAFRVSLSGLPVRATGSSSGFTSPTHSWTAGNQYYALTNASIGASGSATVTVPVTVARAGQWVIDAGTVTNTAHTIPIGTPATLTVATTVELSDNTAVTITPGASQTFTVKYPGTVIAAQAVTVNLSYSGATGDFSDLPATVVIPAGSNSASFTVTSAASATGSSTMVITLNSTNRAFATIGTPASVNIRATNLTAGAIGVAQFICYGATPATLTQTTAPSGGGGTGSYTYQWQSSADDSSWSDINGAKSATYSPGALTASTYFRRNVTSGTYGTMSGASVLITVYPVLTAGAIGEAQSICSGKTPATLTQTAAPGGGTGNYTYQWQRSTDNSTWTDINGAKNAAYSPDALTVNTYFRRNVTSGSCVTFGTSVLIEITIDFSLTVNDIADKTGYFGSIISTVTFSSPTSGATFSWTNSNPDIGLAASGTGNQPQFTAAKSGTATITVTPSHNGCSGVPSTYTITIDPFQVPVNPHLRVRVGSS
ncbi:MAG: hypothetical protein LBK65_08400 [Tannerellaceae bacterium]|jgi:hypothetical protein|nr:hypothetical protein [Tannerellaceae bacterium]